MSRLREVRYRESPARYIVRKYVICKLLWSGNDKCLLDDGDVMC